MSPETTASRLKAVCTKPNIDMPRIIATQAPLASGRDLARPIILDRRGQQSRGAEQHVEGMVERVQAEAEPAAGDVPHDREAHIEHAKQESEPERAARS